LILLKSKLSKDREKREKGKEKRRQQILKNDSLCGESGFPIETFGNDGVGATLGNNAEKKLRRLQVRHAMTTLKKLIEFLRIEFIENIYIVLLFIRFRKVWVV
jgi:hypothetical protein